jgi:hypothetical protein
LFNAQIAPLSLVSALTIKPDGTFKGVYWGMVGAENFGLNGVPFGGTIQVNADCTGTVQYAPPANTEQFVILNNGDEIRTISAASDVPFAAWQTTLHRISNHYQSPLTSCGQQNLRGAYVLRCEALQPLTPGFPAFGAAGLFRIQVSGSGDFTGTALFKIGPATLPSPISGKFEVNPDCTLNGGLNVAALPGVTDLARGVLFDQGKEFYIQPIADMTTAGSTPILYASCQATSLGQ